MSPPNKCFLVLCFCVWLPVSAFGQVTVDGIVRDSSGKVLMGVKVSLYAVGKKDPIDTTRTDKDGFYKFNRQIQSIYDIMYSHTEMDMVIVEMLAEDKNQQINIKMHKRGQIRSVAAYHGAMQSVERALVIALLLKPEERDKFMQEYVDSGASALVRSIRGETFGESPKELRDLLIGKLMSIEKMQTMLGVK